MSKLTQRDIRKLILQEMSSRFPPGREPGFKSTMKPFSLGPLPTDTISSSEADYYSDVDSASVDDYYESGPSELESIAIAIAARANGMGGIQVDDDDPNIENMATSYYEDLKSGRLERDYNITSLEELLELIGQGELDHEIPNWHSDIGARLNESNRKKIRKLILQEMSRYNPKHQRNREPGSGSAGGVTLPTPVIDDSKWETQEQYYERMRLERLKSINSTIDALIPISLEYKAAADALISLRDLRKTHGDD